MTNKKMQTFRISIVVFPLINLYGAQRVSHNKCIIRHIVLVITGELNINLMTTSYINGIFFW